MWHRPVTLYIEFGMKNPSAEPFNTMWGNQSGERLLFERRLDMPVTQIGYFERMMRVIHFSVKKLDQSV